MWTGVTPRFRREVTPGKPFARWAHGSAGGEDGRSEGRSVIGRIGIEKSRLRQYPARKGADVRSVLRRERV